MHASFECISDKMIINGKNPPSHYFNILSGHFCLIIDIHNHKLHRCVNLSMYLTHLLNHHHYLSRCNAAEIFSLEAFLMLLILMKTLSMQNPL